MNNKRVIMLGRLILTDGFRAMIEGRREILSACLVEVRSRVGEQSRWGGGGAKEDWREGAMRYGGAIFHKKVNQEPMMSRCSCWTGVMRRVGEVHEMMGAAESASEPDESVYVCHKLPGTLIIH